MVAVFLTCGLASEAEALPLAGPGQAVVPLVQPVAHKPNEWYWDGHWWRPGPWSDHVIVGMYPRRGHHMLFRPRDSEHLEDCSAKYRSDVPTPQTYVTKGGECCPCR